MKSMIRIGVDFSSNNEPILEIVVNHESADLRDQMLKQFCQSLNGSNVLTIDIDAKQPTLESQTRYVVKTVPANKTIDGLIHPLIKKLTR